ncbi:HDOD domain-containing protein [Sulfurimonas paralvinellae]|uniref:HDOD domain-containing protein n=1 Tax=Sulfurimonas paralvinellae TaxID=317658 RepID=A0A7M1B663_9BACT|nr:HDOD domain-containing protein [Sulfurimonas paralvinellae]QOP45150.1 HDOD domain-containing protein [Sulfurimonas paralvinellae]
MITQEQIDAFIEKIPPSPKALRETIFALNAGDLPKAALAAKEDKALSSYLKNLVNKPIYGFRSEVSDVAQIFGILGVSRSQQAVYNYMVTLLSPAKWQLFKLNRSSFNDLQAELSVGWQKILQHLDINDKEIESAVSLLPASIIVSEALFSQKINDVKLLRSVHNIDFNTILKRLCSMDLFDICEQISKKWEMDKKIAQIIQAASGVKPAEDDAINELGKWMHLLLFFTLSKAEFIEAGLNDFVDFQIEYVSDIYDDFANIMEIA